MKSHQLFLLFLFLFPVQINAQISPITIDLENSGVKLNAKLYLADQLISPPTLILLHGFPGNENSPYGLAERLNNHGVNVLVFNYEGSFSSEGAFTFENCMDDIDAAIRFLKDENNRLRYSIDTSNITVCGFSLGSALLLSAAVHNPEIRKIVAVAGGNDLSIYLQKMANDPEFRIAFEKNIAGSVVPNGPIKGDSAYIHQYFDRIISKYEYFDVIKNADKLENRKILFITGWLDVLVPMEEFIIPTYRILKSKNPESVTIKAFETDHFFASQRDLLAKCIVEWVKSVQATK